MLITFFRTIILYITIVIVTRLMGKRQIGQLQPFEFVVTIMIAELASIPMEETGIPLIRGITPIIVLLAAHVAISFLTLKHQPSRSLICGTPSVLIKNGKIIEKELYRLRYNINDLLEQLRIKNYPNINEIEFAILETNGEISVIPKGENTPVVVKDINIKHPPPKLPTTLVLDGVVQTKNMKSLNISEEWLLNQLQAYSIQKPEDAFIAILDTNGNFHAQAKGDKSQYQSSN
ncbi:MAG: hypothetical protein PWQ82_540 [Thermosediminibacterales bacterium]|nr:hypothetical protein [Thermosediminibacterales bacterium]MDK2835954.1 hypothetical protein [Thermosediminibacterales bacterium]